MANQYTVIGEPEDIEAQPPREPLTADKWHKINMDYLRRWSGLGAWMNSLEVEDNPYNMEVGR